MKVSVCPGNPTWSEQQPQSWQEQSEPLGTAEPA